MGSAADWATAAVTLIVGVAGIFLALNINKDLKLRLAERRLAAYERLWALMRPASPYSNPLDEAGRRQLQAQFTNWYYRNGDGIMLERVSRTVYFEAKDNLVRPVEMLTPKDSRVRLGKLGDTELERQRGLLAQRQLSLLRTQLKSDLTIFGEPYGEKLGKEDRAFLAYCGVNISRKPWSGAVDKVDKAARPTPEST